MYFNTATQFPLQVWGFLIITGLFQATYYASLAGAYRNGDISIAYPISRSTPIIVVSVVTLILGRSDQLSEICVFGIILVVTGCFIIPLKKFTDFHLKNYFNLTCSFALLAAIAASGYSIIDDEALRQLRMNANINIGNTEITILYFFFEAVSASFCLLLFVVVRNKGRSDLIQVMKTNIHNAVIVGIGIHVTYLIVLISLAFVSNVTYVVGFRQISIPLGTVLGILILKEIPYMPKIFGVIIMFTGLMMVAVG
jgi:drug/metabolite transporter (DMT)-like permease